MGNLYSTNNESKNIHSLLEKYEEDFPPLSMNVKINKKTQPLSYSKLINCSKEKVGFIQRLTACVQMLFAFMMRIYFYVKQPSHQPETLCNHKVIRIEEKKNLEFSSKEEEVLLLEEEYHSKNHDVEFQKKNKLPKYMYKPTKEQEYNIRRMIDEAKSPHNRKTTQEQVYLISWQRAYNLSKAQRIKK